MTFLQKYKYWIYAGKFTAIQKIAVLVIGVFSFMILARQLGPADFGIWGLFISIAAITETARTALVRNAFIKFMHQVAEDEQSSLQGSAFMLNLILSVLLSVVFICFSGLIANFLKAPVLASMLRYYSIALILSTFFTHAEMLLNAKMIFNRILWLQISRQGTLLFLIICTFFLNLAFSPILLLWYYIAAIAVGVFVSYLISKPYLDINFRNTNTFILQLWKFGRFVFGNNVSSLLFRSTDGFITSYYFGTAVTAYYSASLRISNLVDMPSVVFADILFPKAAKFDSKDLSSVKHVYEKTVGATLVFSVPALLIILLFPEFILSILAGKEYIQAAGILRVTAFFGFTLPFLRQFGTIMDATGQPKIAFRLMFFALIFNIPSNLVCVYMLGPIGAAIGTAFTYFLLFIISQYIMYKRFHVLVKNIFINTWGIYSEILKFDWFRSNSKLKI
jgi:lipopolysaccharide exporter